MTTTTGSAARPVFNYNPMYRLLHWGMALLVLSALTLIELKGYLAKGDLRYAVGYLHIQAGLLVFLLIWMRLLWRATHPLPPISPALTLVHKIAANLTHWVLYFMMAAIPLLGILMLQSKGKAVALFGMTLPVLLDEDTGLPYALSLKHYHELLGNILIGLIALHVVSAILHHSVRRDNTLKRMLPWLK